MKKITLLSVLLAAVIVQALDEDGESESGLFSGVEESDGFDDINVSVHKEKQYDDEYHEDHEKNDRDEWKLESHDRKRRAYNPCTIIGCSKCGILNLSCDNCTAGYQKKGTRCAKIVSSTQPPKSNVHQQCKGVPNCLQCPFYTMGHFCLRCAPGWKLHKTTWKCIKTCPKGYQATNSKQGLQCSVIKPKCPIPGCEQCPKNNRTCEKCSGNGILHRDSSSSVVCVIKCPYSYYQVTKKGKRVCEQQAGCDDHQCNTCLKSWFKADYNGRICHKQCPPGYSLIKKTKFCKKCTKGCTKCNANGCVKCNQGLSLYVKRKYIWGIKFNTVSCLWTCPPGYNRVIMKGKGYQCHKVPTNKRPVAGKLP